MIIEKNQEDSIQFRELKVILPLLKHIGLVFGDVEQHFENLDSETSGTILVSKFQEFFVAKIIDFEQEEMEYDNEEAAKSLRSKEPGILTNKSQTLSFRGKSVKKN